MPDHPHGPSKTRNRFWLIVAAVLLLLALIFVPPYISLNHYHTRVTQLVATALGRPVRLSDIELRLLPRPGFLLTDLTVQEEPQYGAEPVLHADEVTAAIRLSALWSGKLQISRISVDDASLNLVHMPDGRWNLDSLFRNAAAGSGKTAQAPPPPYLEATDSRINIKNGAEKLPFSLIDADASMWRESNGNWRVRLRGQPARTDVSLDLGDTGIVRLEANLKPAPQLNQMPLHVDIDWRQAQLGQLTRLLLSSDEGWRGDLTGEVHIDGTTASAKVQTRLRASGVRRAEFVPAAPIDFDASCAFTLQYNRRTVNNILCNTPIGDGRARLTGDLPGNQSPHLTLELNRVPAQAALDVLRTMRRSIDPSLQAAGSLSGHMTYSRDNPDDAPPSATRKNRTARLSEVINPLSGTFTITGLRITGDSLSKSIQFPDVNLEPAAMEEGQPVAVSMSAALPAGAPVPLDLTARFALRRFQLGIHGSAALPRLREFAVITGSSLSPVLGQFSGSEPAALDVTAEGPWVPPADVLLAGLAPSSAPPPSSIQTGGTISLRTVTWKASFLTQPVKIAAATLHFEESGLRWDPVAFIYGPIAGTATLDLPQSCSPDETCRPTFTAHFADLNGKELQAALLGAQQKETVLSSLLARFSSNGNPPWPELKGTVSADSLVLGRFTLSGVSAAVRILPTGADVSSFDGGLLGGSVHGTASLQAGDKPSYKLDGTFTGAKAAEVGKLADMKWSGGALSGSGTLELTGYSAKDLGGSATGKLRFEWHHGAIAGTAVPPALSRFDLWTGDATIHDGRIIAEDTRVQHGARRTTQDAELTFGNPGKVSFSPAAKSSAASTAAR